MREKVIRGDLFFADLEPVRGSEQGGYRPVVIIQNNIGNQHSPTVIVAPVTSQKKKAGLPTHVDLIQIDGLEKHSIVLLEQIRTLDKSRLGDYIGQLPPDMMNRVNRALVISVGLFRNTPKSMTLTLCPVCANQFFSSPDHIIFQSNPAQAIKEPCMFCHTRMGYDFIIYNKEKS